MATAIEGEVGRRLGLELSELAGIARRYPARGVGTFTASETASMLYSSLRR